jgi:hypothetical protein
LSSRMQRGESIPSLSDGRAASACCRTGCSDCWSYYSAKSFPILKMQSRLQHPLEIVLACSADCRILKRVAALLVTPSVPKYKLL